MNFKEAIVEILLGSEEEYVQARQEVAGNLDRLAELFGPRIRELSRFRTQLDIEAVQQMQAAGIDMEQAVMLRASANIGLANRFSK